MLFSISVLWLRGFIAWLLAFIQLLLDVGLNFTFSVLFLVVFFFLATRVIIFTLTFYFVAFGVASINCFELFECGTERNDVG